jgi:hypothetical protein
MNMALTVGAAIAHARARAAERRAASPRKLRVRILTEWGDLADGGDGLVIVARIPARVDQELTAQEGLGVRRVAWSELDDRAGELVDLVDQAADEIEAAVAACPAPIARPSQDGGADGAPFGDFTSDAAKLLSEAARQALDSDDARVLGRPAAIEGLMLAALELAALAAFLLNLRAGDAQEAWRDAVANVLRAAPDRASPLQTRRFDA